MVDLKAEALVVSGGADTGSVDRNIRAIGVSEHVLRSYFSHQAATTEGMLRWAFQRMAADLGILPASKLIEDVEWHAIKATDFDDLKYLWRGRLSAVTTRRFLSALRGLARVCFQAGSMSGDQYARIREVKLPNGSNRAGRGRRVERRYQKLLIDNCLMDDRVQGIRDAALLAILFGSGIRRAEAVSIKEGDLDLVEGEIKVVVKGGDTVIRFLSAWAFPYIREWLDFKALQEKAGGYVFVRVNKSGIITSDKLTGRGVLYLLEQRSIKSGLDFNVRPHDARRTMGTEMIEEHGELIAQRVLGHANLDTTRIYDKRNDDVLRNIMAGRK